jgi:hypothetical protein
MVGMVSNEKKFHFEKSFSANKSMMYPYLCCKLYKHSRETTTKARPFIEADVKQNASYYKLPTNWVFNARHDVLTASFLAELGAEANWFDVLLKTGEIELGDLKVFMARDNT